MKHGVNVFVLHDTYRVLICVFQNSQITKLIVIRLYFLQNNDKHEVSEEIIWVKVQAVAALLPVQTQSGENHLALPNHA